MRKNWYWWLGGILVVTVLALWLIPTSSEDSAAPILYTVKKGPLAIEVTTTGELRSAQSEDIMGPTALRKIGIYQVKLTDIIAEGTVVDSGDYVASLDKSEIANKLQELETELQLEQSKLEQAKLDTSLELSQARNEIINLRYDVEEKRFALEQSKYEPPAVIRQAEIALDKAERALAEAKENYLIKQKQSRAKVYEIQTQVNLKLNQYNQMLETLGEFTIHAPKPGMVIYARDWGGQKVTVGSNVSAWNPVVATLPDLTKMISKTFVNEIDISKVKVGQKVRIQVDAFPDRQYTGVVKSVANVGQEKANSTAKVFEVEISLNEVDTTLRPSMTTSNTITIANYDSVTYVPLDCIHDNDTAQYVFIETEDGLVRKEIIPGMANALHTTIIYGLVQGDRLRYSMPDNAEDLPFLALPKDIEEKYTHKPVPAKAREDTSKALDMKQKFSGGKFRGGKSFRKDKSS